VAVRDCRADHDPQEARANRDPCIVVVVVMVPIIAAISIIAGIADVPAVIRPVDPISSIIAGVTAIAVAALGAAAVGAIVAVGTSAMPSATPASTMSSSAMMLSDCLGRQSDQQGGQADELSMSRAARHRAPAFLRVFARTGKYEGRTRHKTQANWASSSAPCHAAIGGYPQGAAEVSQPMSALGQKRTLLGTGRVG